MLILKQTLTLIAIWNNGIYIYACVSVCIYFISHYIYYFLVKQIVCFCHITSNSFDVKSDDFCLLKMWIYKLKGSTMKITLWVFKNTKHFHRKVLLLSLTNAAVDINAKTLKENGILLSKFAQDVVEARILRNIAGWDYLLGYWFKVKFPEIWLDFYMTVLPQITFIDQRTEYVLKCRDKTIEDLRSVCF